MDLDCQEKPIHWAGLDYTFRIFNGAKARLKGISRMFPVPCVAYLPHAAYLPLRRLVPVYRHLDVAEMQSQVLDGVRQAAAVHAVARGVAADGGQLL